MAGIPGIITFGDEKWQDKILPFTTDYRRHLSLQHSGAIVRLCAVAPRDYRNMQPSSVYGRWTHDSMIASAIPGRRGYSIVHGMGDRLRVGKPPQYKPPMPTQPPTLSRTGNSIDQSAVMAGE